MMRPRSRSFLRACGLALAVASVILPALPFFNQPPLPLAVLWLAYGWAAEGGVNLRAPLALMALGLLHDQLAGGPYGVFPVLYLSAYVIGREAAVRMSAPNRVSLVGGFVVTAGATVAIAYALAPLAFGSPEAARPYAEAAAITALGFVVTHPLYVTPSAALLPGARK